MKLAFLGTPEVAAHTMEVLVAAGHELKVAVTRPDKRRGRGADASASPVKSAALSLGVPVVYSPEEALAYGADLGVVVAYGRLVKPGVLEQLPLVNVHFSLLPRWRGAAPVERAILAGDSVTGVCIMALEEGLDTGPLYAHAEVAIDEDETAGELRSRLGVLGSQMLTDLLERGLPEPVPQAGEPTYAAKIAPEELRLNFSAGARPCHRVVRVGRAWTTFRGRRLLVHRVALCRFEADRREADPRQDVMAPGEIHGDKVGTGQPDMYLRLVEVQPEGKPRMPAEQWVRGARLAPGERLGT